MQQLIVQLTINNSDLIHRNCHGRKGIQSKWTAHILFFARGGNVSLMRPKQGLIIESCLQLAMLDLFYVVSNMLFISSVYSYVVDLMDSYRFSGKYLSLLIITSSLYFIIDNWLIYSSFISNFDQIYDLLKLSKTVAKTALKVL